MINCINWIKLNKLIATLIGIGTLLGLFYGGWQVGWNIFSSQFASASEFKIVSEDMQSVHKGLQKLEERLDQKIIQDELARKQQRLWDLSDRYENKKIPADIKQEMRELQSDIDQLKSSQKQWDSEHK